MTHPRVPRIPRLLLPHDDPLIGPHLLLLVPHSVLPPFLPTPPSSRLTDPLLSPPPDRLFDPLSVPPTVQRSHQVFPWLHPSL